jgi:hypothetical protein
VSETWTTEFNESIEELEASLPETTTPESRSKIAALLANGGLDKISRLDTCVTVVDATTVRLALAILPVLFGRAWARCSEWLHAIFQFLSDFDTTDFLSDRHAGQVTPEDERYAFSSLLTILFACLPAKFPICHPQKHHRSPRRSNRVRRRTADQQDGSS